MATTSESVGESTKGEVGVGRLVWMMLARTGYKAAVVSRRCGVFSEKSMTSMTTSRNNYCRTEDSIRNSVLVVQCPSVQTVAECVVASVARGERWPDLIQAA